ncbi:hypothetical protein ANHYDRO_01735 [Anaerococcus hydrogenalis DSM 7454]|uniref:Uncharacterized protein n=1 Tax=Anaerococcus hydrogenalis DSM 7454 TaxID=561177 RepID=B6WAL8_9FIRM|nr:hypothetical protein ANHYDRO_01735 [Anaerococcus hydrogenalis DSM 7454]
MDKNDENKTKTNISSQDAPARIICGIDFSTPLFSSINFTILGTTTAGDTAARTDPINKASIGLILKKILAKIKYPKISKLAGRKDNKTADFPAFFKSEISKESPAFIKIIIRAICLSSADMDKVLGSIKFRTWGPKIIPVKSMPIRAGIFIFYK